MQKKMNLGGLLGQAQKMATNGDTQKNGDPTEDKIKAAKLQLQMSQDYKKLNKKDFKTKYASINPDDKKLLGIKDDEDLNSLMNDLKDGAGVFIEGEEGLQNDINKYTKQYETIKSNKIKQEQEQEQERVKQEQLFNTSKTDLENYNKLKGTIKDKYKYDVNSNIKPVNTLDAYRKGVVNEAEERIKTRKDVKVPGQPKNTMTCISGTCTLAANQGVDFSKMAGAKGQGVRDEKGRVIPTQNAAFLQNLDLTGYEEIPIDQRQPGDFIQYDDESGKPVHMEAYLGKEYNDQRKEMQDRMFNNYSLTNDTNPELRAGESFRTFKNGSDYMINGKLGHKTDRAFRLKQDAADAAYAKLHPEYGEQLAAKKSFESSDDFKNYTELNNKIESLKKTNPDLYKKLTTTPTENTTTVKN